MLRTDCESSSDRRSTEWKFSECEGHMKVHGSCHCGRITYEATIDPEKVSLCNCTDCQVFTGSAFARRSRIIAVAQAHRVVVSRNSSRTIFQLSKVLRSAALDSSSEIS